MKTKPTTGSRSVGVNPLRVVVRLKTAKNIIGLQQFIGRRNRGLRLSKLFHTVSRKKILELVARAKRLDPNYEPIDFSSYYLISCTNGVNPNKVARELAKSKDVNYAYADAASDFPPSAESLCRPWKYQGYLNGAPSGMNVRYAWRAKGGDGRGVVKFIDIEQGWLMDHEAYAINQVWGFGINHSYFRDHGAAVLGIINMKGHSRGIGITPCATGYVVSQWRPNGSFNNADAIMTAASHLAFGDILLLESQVSCLKSEKVWPLEIQEATFDAIRLATALGIIVVEASGNGNWNESEGNDLDDFRLRKKKILNPRDKDFRDSGAIMVAAGSALVPHARMPYSNYGRRVNCYSWGEGVHTAGNHPRSSGYTKNLYIDNFGGTSSAAEIGRAHV